MKSLSGQSRIRSSRSSGVVTLHDVAKIAGVSPITVSRVLNQPKLVAPATIERVQEVIDRTGYIRNMLAGGLASSKTHFVATIVPAIANQIFSASVQALTDRLWKSGYQMLLGTSGYPASREDDLLAAILCRRPDGIILTGIAHSAESRRRLIGAKVPIVEIWDLTPTPIDMLVGFSHADVGQSVAEFFMGLGHKRFGIISADDIRAEVRRTAFVSTLTKNGLTDVLTSIVPAPSNHRLGREGLTRLLKLGPLPRAIFCSSDALAHGVLAEAQSRGINVPGDIAIIGFGDLDFAAYTFPAISTVRIDSNAIGRRAAEALLARLEGKEIERIVDIGFEIVQRGTT